MGIIHSFFLKSRIKSPWLLHYDCGSCNGCDIEVLACLTPVYDLERFGIINVGNPKHADIFLVTGTVNPRNRKVLLNLYRQIPAPKLVVALGSCALTGGIFREAYNVIGGVDQVIPVDIYVPGCPPRPESMIDGVLMALNQWAPQNKPLPGRITPDKVGASCLLK
jgi:ech hydrogenase subunit C